MIVFAAYRPWAIAVYKKIKAKKILVKNNKELVHTISSINRKISALVLIGWSSFISKKIIDKYLCVCYHPSDLPKYRGGSPIQNQIVDGVINTKGTLFKINSKIDEGPVFAKANLSLKGDMTNIFKNLEKNALKLIKKFIKNLQNGSKLIFTPQDQKKATFYKRRTPAMSEIKIEDLISMKGNDLYNKMRCLGDPYPNSFFRTIDGKIILFKKVQIK
jgi:methionyl-tRNA formyltransferase